MIPFCRTGDFLCDVFSFQSLDFFLHFVSEIQWNATVLPSYWRYRFVNVQFDTMVFDLPAPEQRPGYSSRVFFFFF